MKWNEQDKNIRDLLFVILEMFSYCLIVVINLRYYSL